MDEAARQLKQGNMQQAAARGEMARNELNRAGQKLELAQFDSLEKAVKAADDRAQDIAGQQQRIRTATEKVMTDFKNRIAREGGKPETAKLNPSEAQKIKGIERMQDDNQKAAENLESYVNDLANKAEHLNKKEAGDELKKAGRAMKNDDLGQNMITSTVALKQKDLPEALEVQNKIDTTLTRLTKTLRAANNALAQTNEEKVKRAIGEAKDILDKAHQLAGKSQPGETNTDPVKSAENKGHDADKNADASKQNPAAADTTKLTPEARKALAAEIKRDTARLAQRIEDDKLGDASLAKSLNVAAAEGDKSFEEMFKDEQKTKLDAYLNSVKAVSSHLESKLESTLKAKRLSSAQREQTPPQYRVMVNQYYEQLAKE
jgi:hypothetical protein